MCKSSRRILFVILTAALLLRIGLVIAQPVTAQSLDRLPDQREYLSLAQNLLQHGSLSFFDPRFGQTVYAYRMPGYPILLAACGASVSLARVEQCLIDVSSVLAIFLITRQLLFVRKHIPVTSVEGRRAEAAALIAAALVALDPFYIYFANLLLSETLFAALVVWGIYFLLRHTMPPFLVGVAFLIAAAYVKTTGLLMFPAVVFVFILNFMAPAAYRLSDLRRVCLICVPFFLMLFLAMIPWTWRNHQLLDSWIWTTTNSGVTLYDSFHPGVTGASDQRFITALPGVMSMNEVQRSRFLAASARNWAFSNWTQIPKLSAMKILRGWSPIPLSRDFGKPVYRIISAAYSIPFDLLCLVGLFSPRLTRRAKLLIGTPALVVTMGMVMSVGSIRYRMPAEAPLAVLASVGVIELFDRRKFEERNLE